MHVFFKGLLILILSSSIHLIQAQTSQAHVFSDSDTAALSAAMQPEAADAQLTSQESQAIRDSLSKLKYAVEQFKQVYGVKKDILWSDELIDKVQAFYDSTFIMIHSTVRVQDRGILINLVNSFGSILENGSQDPFVRVKWTMNPTTARQLPCSLSIQIEHGRSISAEWMDSLELHYNTRLHGHVYAHGEDGATEILGIMDSLLNALGTKYGKSLAPSFALFHGEERLSNGHRLTFMYTGDETTSDYEEIYAGTLSGDPLEDQVHWVNADSSAYSYAYIGKDTIKSYTLKAITSRDTVELAVSIITNDARLLLRSIIEEILVSVAQDMIDYYYAQYTEHRTVALSSAAVDSTSITPDSPIATVGDYDSVSVTEPVSFGPTEAYPLSSAEYEALMNDPSFHAMINRKRRVLNSANGLITEMKAIAVLKEMIRPENFELVRDDVIQHLDSHVSALGSMFINAVFSGDRNRMRLLFRNYMNNRLDHFYEVMNNRQ